MMQLPSLPGVPPLPGGGKLPGLPKVPNLVCCYTPTKQGCRPGPAPTSTSGKQSGLVNIGKRGRAGRRGEGRGGMREGTQLQQSKLTPSALSFRPRLSPPTHQATSSSTPTAW